MTCPHCGYKHGWDQDSIKTVKGKEGGFYTISNEIQMEREEDGYYRAGGKRICGCPKCKKLFFD